MMIESPGRAIPTETSSSPSLSSMAQMPAVRGRENASSAVFLTVPLRVAKNTELSASKAFTRSTVWMSSCCSAT